jgi:hypothetical protein
MKKTNRKQRNNMRSRLPIRRFDSIVLRTVATTASTYATNSNFTYANLLGDFASSDRVYRVKSFRVEFAPLNILGTTAGTQNLSVQLALFDIKTSEYIASTPAKPLNNSTRTMLAFSAPADIATFGSAVSSGGVMRIIYYNAASGSAVSFNIQATVYSSWEASHDEPIAV